MKRKFLILLSILSLTTISACGTPNPDSASSIADSSPMPQEPETSTVQNNYTEKDTKTDSTTESTSQINQSDKQLEEDDTLNPEFNT